MWMQNTSICEEEQDGGETWKLTHAFAEDTNMGIMPKWPPRSYTCTFCRREFRSAQALGGHMNVHRRDRARLHHQSTHQAHAHSMTTGSTTLIYHQPPNNCSTSTNNMYDTMPCYYNNEVKEANNDEILHEGNEVIHEEKVTPIEELDLELRLGHISTPKSQHEQLFHKNVIVFL